MSLADYIRVLRRSWLLIIVLTGLGGVLGLLYADTQPKLYRSFTSAMVIYRQGGTTSEVLQGSSYVQNNVQTYALLATSPYVLRPVIDQLKLDETPAALGRRIAVDTPLNTTILQIAVTDENQERASVTADAVTSSLTRAVSELAPEVGGQSSVRLQTIAPATRPQTFVSPDRRLFVAVGAGVGLAVAVAAAFLHDVLRSRPRNADDLAMIDAPTLGELPRTPRGMSVPEAVLDQPTGPMAEATRTIAANLGFVSLDKPAEAMIITSARPSEGKSSMTVALGLTLAAANQRTLIVDADLRSPRIASLLGIEGSVGLTSVLVSDVSLSDAVQQWGHENLSVLTAGRQSPNPGQLISSGQLTDIIAEARALFDKVIIDTPPVEPVSDALWLAPSTDGVILVARARKTPMRALQQAVEAVTATRTPVLGIVMNGVTHQRDSRYHGKPYGENPARAGGSLERGRTPSRAK